MHLFPVEVNHAPLEMLLRVPGIGAKNAYKIIEARKYTKLTFESLTKMRVALKRAKHFITCNGKFFGAKNEEAVRGFLPALHPAKCYDCLKRTTVRIVCFINLTERKTAF